MHSLHVHIYQCMTNNEICTHAYVKKNLYEILFYLGNKESLAENTQHYMPIHIYTNMIMYTCLHFDMHIYITIYNFASL